MQSAAHLAAGGAPVQVVALPVVFCGDSCGALAYLLMHSASFAHDQCLAGVSGTMARPLFFQPGGRRHMAR
jgi:hypothetical protein